MSKYSNIVIVVLVALILMSIAYGQITIPKDYYYFLPAEYEVDAYTVALWHFDEGTGFVAYDETTNWNTDGKLNPIASFTTETAPIRGSDYGVFFNDPNLPGTKAYISVPDSNPSLNLLGDFTIEAWVKRINPITGVVLEKGIAQSFSTGGYSIEITGTDGHIRLQKITSTYVVSNATIDDNEWTHIAVTNNVTNGEVKFYKNGILMQTVIDTNPILPTNQPLYLGHAIDNSCNNNWGWAPFFGYMDEVRISDKVRSPSEFNVPR